MNVIMIIQYEPHHTINDRCTIKQMGRERVNNTVGKNIICPFIITTILYQINTALGKAIVVPEITVIRKINSTKKINSFNISVVCGKIEKATDVCRQHMGC